MAVNPSQLPVADKADGTPGSAAPASAQQVGGTDGTNLRTLSTDTSGRLNVNSIETLVDTTYSTINITAQDIVSTTSSNANAQIFVIGTPTANSAAVFAISSKDSAKIEVTGTWTGTLVIEQSFDSSTTWVSTGVHQTGTSYTVSSFTGNFIGSLNISGSTAIRVRSTASWTGTATVRAVTSINPTSIYIANGITIQDVVTPNNKAVIKAASTAAAAADTSLVVALSPNSPDSSVYNSSLPTPSNAATVPLQSNEFGELTVQYRNKFTNITGNTTVQVKSGAGRLHGIMVNRNWTSGTAIIYDNTASSGTIIATVDFGSPSGGLLSSTGLPGPIMMGPLGIEFSTGLRVVTSGSTSNNITILYQ